MPNYWFKISPRLDGKHNLSLKHMPNANAKHNAKKYQVPRRPITCLDRNDTIRQGKTKQTNICFLALLPGVTKFIPYLNLNLL